jgi:hypothetical protein
VSNKVLIGIVMAMFAGATAGCNTTDNANANANANANVQQTIASDTTRPGPDNSEITTSVDANGVKTETRVFHNSPRVSRVVVTTREGRRTTTVYAPSGESKELKNEAADALVATGDAIGDAVGFVAGKTKEGAKVVGEKTVEGAKTVVDKTAEGAKKTGKAIKKAVTP